MTDIAEQPLPRTFEEFNEQRRASFIRVKDYKQAGNRLVGYLCSYTPLEIIDAAGAAGVALCGTSDEVIPEAEKVLPANLCPLIKSTYGFAYSQKCPFTYFSDLIIGETTCDGKKKMYELLSEPKPVHILRLPQGRDRAWERQGWREECRLLKERLEQLYGITITDDDLRAAARRRNRLRAAQLSMFELQAAEPPVMGGVELMSTMFAGTFNFDVEDFTRKVEQTVAERRAAYEAGERPIPASSKRILITGCPVGGVINKIGRTIERNMPLGTGSLGMPLGAIGDGFPWHAFARSRNGDAHAWRRYRHRVHGDEGHGARRGRRARRARGHAHGVLERGRGRARGIVAGGPGRRRGGSRDTRRGHRLRARRRAIRGQGRDRDHVPRRGRGAPVWA